MELTNITRDTVSIVKDPFNKECLKAITIRIDTRILSNDKYCYAIVYFKNGNSSGEQRFGDYSDFKQLMTEVEAFITTLNKVT